MAFKFNPFTGNLDTVADPGGSDTQVQVNDGGVFAGFANLIWNKITNVLRIGGDIELNDGGSFTTTVQCVTPTANRTISYPDATGTVALVAGSSGQLLYNNAGVNAGVSTFTFDGSVLTLSGRLINNYTSLASSPAKAFTGAWFTGGTATTTKPHFLIEPTGTTSTGWSTSGTGLGVNAASGFAGNLLDLQVNGTRQAYITSSGFLGVNSIWGLGVSEGTITFSGSTIQFGRNTSERPQLSIDTAATSYQIRFSSATSVGWTSAGSDSTFDLRLWRDAANTLAQRNGTAAQTFRVYNTFTSDTNHERGYLSWSSNVFRIGTEKGSGGGTARTLELQTDGITRVQITRDGVYRYTQAAPAAVNTTATLTIANLQAGLITSTTGAAVTMTLPTGTDVEGGFAVNANDLTFEWSVINTGSNAATVQANMDHTIVGAGAVAAGTTGRFATRRTAANTYVSYRIS